MWRRAISTVRSELKESTTTISSHQERLARHRPMLSSSFKQTTIAAISGLWAAMNLPGLMRKVALVSGLQQEAFADEVLEDFARVVLGETSGRAEAELRIERLLVGIVDAGEALDLAAARLGAHALDVALLAAFDRGIDMQDRKSTRLNYSH